MDKEIRTLLKMLNGSLKKMPNFLHQTIIQYQWQQAVEGILYFAAAIVLGIIVIKAGLFVYRRVTSEDYRSYDDNWFLGIMLPWLIVGGTVVIVFACDAGIESIGNAISPVTSLITQLHSL